MNKARSFWFVFWLAMVLVTTIEAIWWGSQSEWYRMGDKLFNLAASLYLVTMAASVWQAEVIAYQLGKAMEGQRKLPNELREVAKEVRK